MKCGNPGVRRRKARSYQQVADALLHLVGRLVGESDAQNLFRGHTLLNQVRDAVGDYARLARARASQHKDGSLRGEDSLLLAYIQIVKKIHYAGSLIAKVIVADWNSGSKTLAQKRI